MIECFNPIG